MHAKIKHSNRSISQTHIESGPTLREATRSRLALSVRLQESGASQRHTEADSTLRNYCLAIGAYIVWGVMPIFWALLAEVDARTVLYQRTIWSSICLGVWLAWRGELRSTLASLFTTRTLGLTLMLTTCLGTNWLTYLFALQRKEYLASSIAYYLCPIMSVILAKFLQRERLTRTQLASIIVMLLGTLLPAMLAGELPWLACVIAASWCAYTAIRKTTGVPPIAGLFLETTVLALILSVALPSSCGMEILFVADSSRLHYLLFPVAGLATALPIVALTQGIRSIPLAYAGLLQYLSPTLNIVTFALYFHKYPSPTEWMSITILGFGIAMYCAGAWLRHRALSWYRVMSTRVGLLYKSAYLLRRHK